MKYHPDSKTRLTMVEMQGLELILRTRWADALSSPLMVTEGYEFHQTSVPGSGSESDRTLVVGRAALYLGR